MANKNVTYTETDFVVTAVEEESYTDATEGACSAEFGGCYDPED